MRNDVGDEVDVVNDNEIESPGTVHAGLPQVSCFVVLLGVQRWMVEILKKKASLFIKGFTNGKR